MKSATIVRLVRRGVPKLAVLSAMLILVGHGRDLTAQAAPDWVCFPTCSTTDAKMLTMSGQGVSSLAGQEMFLSLSSAPDSASIIVSVFDGETGGNWDTATASPLMFELYADPQGDGSGVTGTPIVTWAGATMANNLWSDMPPVLNTAAAQACATCAFKYVLRVYPTLALGGVGTSNFKLRTNGIIGLRPQSFGFLAPITGVADARIVYPALPSLTPTTYDGLWTFSFAVPTGGTNSITVWDGDFDWGSWDCTSKDTDDPDSPAFPPFVVTSATLAETNAGQVAGLGTHVCADGTRSSGNPSDDWSSPNYRRTPVGNLGPNSYYTITAPDGKTYTNLEPSGNQEWEYFTIDADPATGFDRSRMDVKAAKLPGGVYTVKVDGMDLGNLNFWRFQYTALGRTQDDKPAPEDAFYKIGRYVWYDTNPNGIPEAGEPPIANVGVTVTDEDGSMQFATTDAAGQFFFRVPRGRFKVVVDADNFLLGKPLRGLASTSGGETEWIEVGPSPLPAYAEAIFGYIEKGGGEPPVARDDTAALLCGTDVTVNVLANDTDADNDTLTVTAVSQPGHGTAALNANGTVTYAPAAGYTGSDSFTYTVSGGTDNVTGTVTVTVSNQPVVALNDTATTQTDAAVTVTVLANDSDPDGTPVSVLSATSGANGSTTVNADGTITYTPNAGYWGSDSFRYTVADSCGTASATVSIFVFPPPTRCTRTIGYWKTHDVQVASRLGFGIWLGGASGAKSEFVTSTSTAVAILSSSDSNGINKLRAQLMAAKLNVSAGAANVVADTIAAADAFLSSAVPSDWKSLSPAQRKQVEAWKTILDNFNNGLLGVSMCDT